MISADVKKLIKTTRNKRSGGCIFIRSIPSKLEIHCKKGMYFSFDFGWYIHLDIVHVKNRAGGVGFFFCLTDKIR